MKRSSEKFLIDQYKRHQKEAMEIRLNNQRIIVPFEYAREGTNEEIKKYFCSDYLDLQFIECEKYNKAGEKPRIIRVDNVSYVVPFKLRNSDKKDTAIVEEILTRCQRKYNHAVSLAKKLEKAYPDKEQSVLISKARVEEMQKEYRHYLWKRCKDKSKYAAIRLVDFAAAGISPPKANMSNLQSKARKLLLSLAVTGSVAAIGYSAFKQYNKAPEPKGAKIADVYMPEEEIPNAEKIDSLTVPQEIIEANISLANNKDTANVVDKASDHAEKLLPAKKIKEFKRSAKEANKLFEKFTAEVFESEGGYADAKKIDQPTNMGIIQSTLNAFWKQYPDEARKAKFPQTVKQLTKNQAKLIYKKQYFEHYRIADYRNESIALLIYDMYVNHAPATVESFVNQGLKAARKKGADVKPIKTTKDRIEQVNKLAYEPEAEKAFYDMLNKERRFLMHKNTVLKAANKSRFAKGLKNRANKYKDTYVSTSEQEQKHTTIMVAIQTKSR